MADQRIAKRIPASIQASRTAGDFHRAMQAKFQHYADRRQFIDEQMAPIFDYLHDVENIRIQKRMIIFKEHLLQGLSDQETYTDAAKLRARDSLPDVFPPKSLGRRIPDLSRFGIYHSASARVPCCYGKRQDHRGQARADSLDQT